LNQLRFYGIKKGLSLYDEATEKVLIVQKVKASPMKSRKLSLFLCIMVVLTLGGVSD